MSEDEMKIVWKTVYIILLAGLCYGLGERQMGYYLMIAVICTWVVVLGKGLLKSYEEIEHKTAMRQKNKAE